MKHEEGRSSSSVATAKTDELSASMSSMTITDHSDHSFRENDSRSKMVCFDLDECNNVRTQVFEYPCVEEEEKEATYWGQKEVARRRRERDAIVEDDNGHRRHFIACVEELFNVPVRKRTIKKSVYSEVDGSLVLFSESPWLVSPVSGLSVEAEKLAVEASLVPTFEAEPLIVMDCGLSMDKVLLSESPSLLGMHLGLEYEVSPFITYFLVNVSTTTGTFALLEVDNLDGDVGGEVLWNGFL